MPGASANWKAKDVQLDRIVAVKVPHRNRIGTDEIEKFLREARAAAQLCHANIVSVHEAGMDGEYLYIVGDFIEGQSLDRWLAGAGQRSSKARALWRRLPRPCTTPTNKASFTATSSPRTS